MYTNKQFTTVSKDDYKVLTTEHDICRFVEEDFLHPIVSVLSKSVAYHEKMSI